MPKKPDLVLSMSDLRYLIDKVENVEILEVLEVAAMAIHAGAKHYTFSVKVED